MPIAPNQPFRAAGRIVRQVEALVLHGVGTMEDPWKPCALTRHDMGSAIDAARGLAKKRRHEYIVFPDGGGSYRVSMPDAESLKAALLSCGTSGRFLSVDRRGAVVRHGWRAGVRWLRNIKLGYL